MTVVYDTGVLVAADRNTRAVWADHRVRLEAGRLPTTTVPVVAQASRSDRQVQLCRFLAGCYMADFSVIEAHRVGALLAAAHSSDVVDGHVVLTAHRLGAAVVTSDLDDLTTLAAALHPPPRVRPLPSD